MQSTGKQTAVAKAHKDGDSQRLPEQPRAPCSETRLSNRDAIRQFTEKNAGAILKRAIRICRGDKDTAEEIVQQLYERLLRTAELAPDRTLHSPWGATLKILGNLQIDSYRKKKRAWKHVKRLEFPDSVPVPDLSHGLTSEEKDALCKAVDSLPDRLRLIVVGIFLEGCKGKDVAAKLQLSESRLAELKQQALKQLMEILRHEF